jgi:hypothetical protein
MKYLKLFENYAREHDIATLRDVVDPDNFSDELMELPLDDEVNYELDTTDAAIWTCKVLGLELGAGPARLQSLGLTDTAGVVKTLPLERVVQVFDTLATTWHDMPRFKAIVKTLPGLFALDEQDDLVQADSAQSIAQENFGSIDVEVWLDPQSGVRAVWWRGEDSDSAYMLDSDLGTAAR